MSNIYSERERHAHTHQGPLQLKLQGAYFGPFTCEFLRSSAVGQLILLKTIDQLNFLHLFIKFPGILVEITWTLSCENSVEPK